MIVERERIGRSREKLRKDGEERERVKSRKRKEWEKESR